MAGYSIVLAACFVLLQYLCVNGRDYNNPRRCKEFYFDGEISSPSVWISVMEKFKELGCLQSAIAATQISRRLIDILKSFKNWSLMS
jgi:hypothetical protein